MMDDTIQQHTAPIDVAEHAGGDFSGMKVLVNFFSKEATNVSDSKYLTATGGDELFQVGIPCS